MSTPLPPLRMRSLRLVRGYQPATYPPPRAYDAGLRQRFAVALDTHRPEAEGMFADVELFLRLVGAVLEAVPHERVVFEVDEDRRVESLSQLQALYAGVRGSVHEPPKHIILTRHGRPVCIIETECRVRVGGPAPYHDAYSAVLYTKEDHATALRHACEQVAGELGAHVVGYDEGAPHRAPFVPLWKRPLQWLGVKAW